MKIGCTGASSDNALKSPALSSIRRSLLCQNIAGFSLLIFAYKKQPVPRQDRVDNPKSK
jgi:hypothetical protein